MSKYTTSISEIINSYNIDNPNKNATIYDKITYALPKIFDYDYEFYNLNENDKKRFEKLFIMYYYNYEIGFETVGLWKLHLFTTLDMIMPYYTELYKTAVYDKNLNDDINITETNNNSKTIDSVLNGKIDNNSTLNSTQNIKSNGNNTVITTDDTNLNGSIDTTIDENKNGTHNMTNSTVSKNLQSDLPQANYNNLDYGTLLNDNNTDITQKDTTQDTSKNISHTENKNETNRNINVTGTDNNTTDTALKTNGNNNQVSNQTGNEITTSANEYHKNGLTGNRTHAEIIQSYRDIIININEMIIKSNDISNLFMKIF